MRRMGRPNVFWPRAFNSLKLSLCSRTYRSNFDFLANRTRSSAAMSRSSEWALSSTTGVAFMKFARSLFSSRLMRASKASSTFFWRLQDQMSWLNRIFPFSIAKYIEIRKNLILLQIFLIAVRRGRVVVVNQEVEPPDKVAHFGVDRTRSPSGKVGHSTL